MSENLIKRSFRYILFDLDGTVTDPGVGITKSVAYALDYFGIAVENLESLYRFIGPPLSQSFMDYYGFTSEKAVEAVAKYREYYSTTGIFENTVYNGMPDLLGQLKHSGKKVILATSKPGVFAVRILEHFGLSEYFDFVAGSELDGTRTDKAEVIAYALEQCCITDFADTVMVGDRMHDIIGAVKNGVTAIGVSYGYGSKDELESAGADFIADSTRDLELLFL